MRLAILISVLFLTGCVRPLKPGFGSIRTPSGVASQIVQSENPKTESKQEVERRVEVTSPSGEKTVTTEKAASTIGAAQKDVAREAAAKLSALRPVTWVGVLVFLFGVASAFYPPLKLIVGSVTTSAVAAIAGLALIVLPTLIVGNELLILCIAGGAVVIYFFAHRHGDLRGTVKHLLK